MTKEIQLTQGQVALVDDWRFEELNQDKWHARWNSGTKSFYAVRVEDQSNGSNGTNIWMHRLVANTPDEMICDHINHNTLDCQEHNLRNVTPSQSAMNRRLRVDNKLHQKNISLDRGSYKVKVKKDGKCVFQRNFSTLVSAIGARDEALRLHHGEFMYLQTNGRKEIDTEKPNP